MKKTYLAALLTVGLSISAFGAIEVPQSASEKPSVFPSYAGVSTCEISNSTGTSQALCTSGSGIILQIVGSSVASTDWLTLRDTGSVNNASTSNILHYTQGGALPLAGVVLPRFYKGLAVSASVAPVATSGFWTIIYSKDLN